MNELTPSGFDCILPSGRQMLGFSRFVPVLVLAGMATALWAAPNDSAPAPAAGSASQVASQLSKEEMQRRAETMKADAESTLQSVSALRARAQKQKDVIKLSCVNDKLVQLKAQMNIADKQQAALAGSLDKEAERNSAYTELSATSDNIRKLNEEAQGCMGETELYKQESGVEVSHPDIVDDPTIIDPYEMDPGLEIEPPGYASAFR